MARPCVNVEGLVGEVCLHITIVLLIEICLVFLHSKTRQTCSLGMTYLRPKFHLQYKLKTVMTKDDCDRIYDGVTSLPINLVL